MIKILVNVKPIAKIDKLASIKYNSFPDPGGVQTC